MTFAEAVRAYKERFGSFPGMLFMGMTDDQIIEAIQKALETNEPFTAELDDNTLI